MKRLPVGARAILISSLTALWAFAAGSAPSSVGTASASAARRPVLLELFTSEGCSSCPPADRLLEKLDGTQPVSGAELIVLSEHVDYWNRLGWADPFSSPLFTERQQDYVTHLRLQTAYTPQLVVDGQQEVVGSDERGAEAAIHTAETRPKTAIGLQAQRSGASVTVALSVNSGARGAKLFVVLADDRQQSQVTRGENAGHTLRYVAVVRTLQLAGNLDARGQFEKQLTLPSQRARCRVIAFLQDARSGKILGAAEVRL